MSNNVASNPQSGGTNPPSPAPEQAKSAQTPVAQPAASAPATPAAAQVSETPTAKIRANVSAPPAPVTFAQSAGAAHPEPKVEIKTPAQPATATSPEYQPARGEKPPTRWLPAPLAALDADYSQVLRMRNVRYLIVIAAVAGALWFGWYLSAIFVPLLIALGIAYMLNPLVEALERRGISRLRAVILIFFAFIAISAAAGTWFIASLAKDVIKVADEFSAVMSDIENKQDEWVDAWNESTPEYVHLKKGELTINQVTGYLRDQVTPRRQTTSVDERRAAAEATSARAALLPGFQRLDKDNSMTLDAGELRADTLKLYDLDKNNAVSPEEWFAHFGAGSAPGEGERVLAPDAQRAAEGLFSVVSSGLMSVLYIGLCIVLVPIYTWFFLLGLPGIKSSIDRYLPGAQRPRIRRILGEIDGMAKSFFRGRLIVVIIISVMTTILFVALDVRYAFLLGLLAGVGILVPFASFIMSMLPAIIIMAVAPDPSWVAIVVMVAIFCGIQAFEQYVLTPKLLGDAVELHPVTLLVGVFVMTYLFGIFGALLAVPLTAIAKTIGREFLLPYFKSLADEPSPSTQTRVIAKP